MRSGPASLVIAAILVSGLFASSIYFSSFVFASGVGSVELKPPRINAASEPAVVMMQTDVHAFFSVPNPSFDSNQLKNDLVNEANNGQLDLNDQNAVMAETFAFLKNNPLRYLIPTTSDLKEDVHTGLIGSGFIISADGYIVTNAHVAAPSDLEARSLVAQQLAGSLLQEIQNFKDSSGFTAEQSDALIYAMMTYLLQYGNLGDVQKDVYALIGLIQSDGNVKQVGYKGTAVAAGESSPGKDIAIVKIEGNNFPTVPLGDEKELIVGDTVYIIGFPGVATSSIFS